MDEVADLVGLSGLVREGIKLVRGCEIAIEGSSLRMGVFSAIPLIKVRNIQVPWSAFSEAPPKGTVAWIGEGVEICPTTLLTNSVALSVA